MFKVVHQARSECSKLILALDVFLDVGRLEHKMQTL